MKKRLMAYLLVMVLILSSIMVVDYQKASASDAIIVFVALDGNEDAAGTIEDPFATIEQARDYLRTLTVDAENPATIYVRGGVYKAAADNPTIELTEEDSYVTISAYEDEKVRITGTVTLMNSRFKKLDEVSGEIYSSSVRLSDSVKNKVYVYDLGAENIPVGTINKNGFNWPKQPFTPELIVDGSIQTLAQYPNSGVMTQTNILCGKTKNGQGEDQTAKAAGANEGERPRNYIFDKTDTPKNYEEMLVMKAPVFYCRNGLEDRIGKWAPPTTEGEPQGGQELPNPTSDNTLYETDGWLSGYFENNYANDMAMIYSVNTEKQTINCKYPSLQGVQDKRIQLTAINLLCELDRSGEYYVDRYNGNNVLYYYPKGGTVEGKDITFTSSADPFFALENAENVTIKNIVMDGSTGYGITMYDCNDCVIDGCELYNISLDAIRIGLNNNKITTDPQYECSRGGKRNTVKNCIIHDMGCGGVYLSGGDERSMERADHVVENCEFYNLSRLQTYTPAVYLEGVGSTVRNNYIHDCPHMVIQIMGNDMTITNNIFDKVATNTSDQGAIYSGRCFTWLGNEISYNLFKNLGSGVYAVYMDDGMSGMLIHHNIFYSIDGSSVFSNNGFGQQIYDNVFANTGSAVYYKRFEGDRPIDNEKILQYRYYRIYREGSGTDFTNTKENIEKVHAHYADLYPYLADLYLPDTNDSKWDSDVNSLFVPANQVLTRSIFIDAGDKNIIEHVKSLQNDKFDTDNYEADSVAALKLNLNTGKFDETSPLADAASYGTDWIELWNQGFDLENTGSDRTVYIPDPTTPPTPDPETPVPTETALPYVIGDVNLDEQINANDALAVLKHAAKMELLDNAGTVRADVNKDQSADAKDALEILKYAAHIIESFE